MSPIETHERNGYTVEINADEGGGIDSPRSYESNMGLFLGFPHRRYDIGDEVFDPSEYTRPCTACEGSGYLTQDPDDENGTLCPSCDGEATVRPTSEAELMEWLRVEHGARVIFKVGMIDHSGVSYYMGGGASASDPGGWDSGTCGYIMDRPDRLKALGCEDFTDEQIWANLTGEIQEYSAWANGEVYYVTVTDDNGDVVESCGGFIGDHVFDESTWSDLVPSDPPPAKLRKVRYTDVTLNTIEKALTFAASSYVDVDGKWDFAGALTTVQASRPE